MVGIPRSEDREVVDTGSLSALTSAFTRLAVALERHVACQVEAVAHQAASGGSNGKVAIHEDTGVNRDDCVSPTSAPAGAVSNAPGNKVTPVEGTPPGAEQDSVLEARSAAAAATLPARPSLIDECIADAVRTGRFDIPPSLTHRTAGDFALPAHHTTSAPRTPLISPIEMSLRVAHEPSAGRWYCVSQGREPGVYSSWEEVSPLVTGVPRAVYIRHGTKEGALEAYTGAYQRGGVIRR